MLIKNGYHLVFELFENRTEIAIRAKVEQKGRVIFLYLGEKIQLAVTWKFLIKIKQLPSIKNVPRKKNYPARPLHDELDRWLGCRAIFCRCLLDFESRLWRSVQRSRDSRPDESSPSVDWGSPGLERRAVLLKKMLKLIKDSDNIITVAISIPHSLGIQMVNRCLINGPVFECHLNTGLSLVQYSEQHFNTGPVLKWWSEHRNTIWIQDK